MVVLQPLITLRAYALVGLSGPSVCLLNPPTTVAMAR